MDRVGHKERHEAERISKAAALNRLPNPATSSDPPSLSDIPSPDQFQQSTGYSVPAYRVPAFISADEIPGPTSEDSITGSVPSRPVAHLDGSAMNPPLRIMCGPMLRFDSVVSDCWYGAAMVVTQDEGSVCDPAPELTVLASEYLPGVEGEMSALALAEGTKVRGENIFVYHGVSGSHTFWRFGLTVPLTRTQQTVRYLLNGAGRKSFVVPAMGQNLHWFAQSCNGFSQGVDQKVFNGPDPLWDDVLRRHAEVPFHVGVGGGDQNYCDSLMNEPELQDWKTTDDVKVKAAYPLSKTMSFAIDRYFFSHNITWFRSGSFGKANSTIPQLNMLDDHDLIDGFGSYDDDTMMSPVFSHIGSRGYFWYLLFQQFTVDVVDGTSRWPAKHSSHKAMIIGEDGPYIPFPSHSLVSMLGPEVALVALDGRAERKLDVIATEKTYSYIFEAISQLPATVKHLVFLAGVPLLYPRMVFADAILSSAYNPLTALAKTGAFGLGSMLNKFNKKAELLDDLSDHWTAPGHKRERNWLIEQMQNIALKQKVRVTFLSGDVHCAAVGRCFSRTEKKPEVDPKYMLQIVSSAIVNTPPPKTASKAFSILAGKTHKSLHYLDTNEDMVDLFTKDTDGSKLKHHYIMARRNWCEVNYKAQGELEFVTCVETENGSGKTIKYPISAPAVQW